VLQAVKQTPDLMRCFSTQQGGSSVLLAAMQAATIGLEPNTPTQEAWLLPRRRKSVWEAQLSIGYRGLLKLARRGGNIKTVYAEVVREKDHFEWSRGLESDVLEHRPYDGPPDGPGHAGGEMTHAYAVARFITGGYNFIVLNRHQVEARREMSDSFKARDNSYSPWVRWPEAMWRKSAIRALAPYLDLSPQAEAALSVDEKPLHFDDEAGVIEVASAFGQLEPGNEDVAPGVDEDGVIEATAEDEAPKEYAPDDPERPM
jgi:recombination protein RecT